MAASRSFGWNGLRRALVGGGLFASTLFVSAGTSTSTFRVSAYVAPRCIVTASDAATAGDRLHPIGQQPVFTAQCVRNTAATVSVERSEVRSLRIGAESRD